FLNDREVAVATRTGIERYDSNLNPIAAYPDALATILASNSRYLGGVTSTGITIWDNATLGIVRNFPLMQPPSALAWHGDTLMAAVPGVGVYCIGVSGADDFVSENARDVAVVGDTLFIAASVNGIVLYDLKSTRPAFVSRTDAGERNFARIAVGS